MQLLPPVLNWKGLLTIVKIPNPASAKNTAIILRILAASLNLKEHMKRVAFIIVDSHRLNLVESIIMISAGLDARNKGSIKVLVGVKVEQYWASPHSSKAKEKKSNFVVIAEA